MSRILVVDDHTVVRAGVRKLLSEIPDADVSEVANGEDALERCATTEFDLVILDLNLPGLGGLELVKRLVRLRPRLPILIFSLHTEAIYATRAMETGARGFISKNATAEELLAAVRTVLAGGTAIEKDIEKEIAGHAIGDNAYLRPLTQRDLEIVRLLASGKSLTQIADTLGVAYKTIANTLSLIKEKLGVGSTADLIRLAINHGLTDLR
jgi:two-component system invasion response regulator UvrY